MFLAILSIIASFILVVSGVFAFAIGDGQLSLLILAIPMLWLIPQGGAATWILLIALLLFGLTVPHQPFPQSIAVWTIFPLLMVICSHRHSLHLSAFIVAIIAAMQAGIMALQYEGKLDGTAWATLVQMGCVVLVWIAVRSWKIINSQAWWPLTLLIPLWAGGFQDAVLVTLSIIGLIACLQYIGSSKYRDWLSMLAWLLPVTGFVTLIISPHIEVPNSIVISWLMILVIGWIVDFMMQVDDESRE